MGASWNLGKKWYFTSNLPAYYSNLTLDSKEVNNTSIGDLSLSVNYWNELGFNGALKSSVMLGLTLPTSTDGVYPRSWAYVSYPQSISIDNYSGDQSLDLILGMVLCESFLN